MKAGLGVALVLLSVSPAFAREPFMPAVIHWGASTMQMQEALKGKCEKMVTRPIDPPFLDNTKKQMQIDCEGFMFRGKPRHAEFVIGDDQLKMVWIMTGPDEDAVLRGAMVAEYGLPDRVNSKYDAFVARRRKHVFGVYRGSPRGGGSRFRLLLCHRRAHGRRRRAGGQARRDREALAPQTFQHPAQPCR